MLIIIFALNLDADVDSNRFLSELMYNYFIPVLLLIFASLLVIHFYSAGGVHTRVQV